MPEWLTILIAVGSGLAGGGAAWGVLTTRVGRLEKDVDRCATSERVDGLERVMEARHDGIEKKLDKIEDTLEAIREELHRAREPTSPGRPR
jgi:hypothetical protein